MLSLAAMSAAAYAEPITLEVDLRDSGRQLFHGHEVIPVKPGPLTLYYPKWIPGEHSPNGPLENLAGLKITAGGKPIVWRRDLTEMWSIHLEVPQGVPRLELSFDFLSPDEGGEFGYQFGYTDTPSEYFKAIEKVRKSQNQMFSIGLAVDMSEHHRGEIQDVLWGSPAFKAGVGPRMKLMAVNGRAFDAAKDVLKDAIIEAKDSKAPIKLLVREQDTFMTFDVDYHGGLKYPVLTRVSGKPAYLDAIIAAH
ncbi:MAG TPA: hypothetical protein VLV87_10225 [Gammaproteobacteria bacterium]|nr:hypothetical protein [Gammaproteobacteria bacterium]